MVESVGRRVIAGRVVLSLVVAAACSSCGSMWTVVPRARPRAQQIPERRPERCGMRKDVILQPRRDHSSAKQCPMISAVPEPGTGNAPSYLMLGTTTNWGGLDSEAYIMYVIQVDASHSFSLSDYHGRPCRPYYPRSYWCLYHGT